MLELIYHSTVFGPIHFHYDRPIIRVGRSEDNDLVLRHPSVEPYHCVLVFQDETLFCLPPDRAVPPETDLESLPGPEFGAGDLLSIGELKFTLAHSARSVAIPEVRPAEARAGADGLDPLAGAGATDRRRYFCPRCEVFLPEAKIKALGLVGHAKRYLCPKCSGVLELEPKAPMATSGSEA